MRQISSWLAFASVFALAACRGPEPYYRGQPAPPVGQGSPVTCHISRAECDSAPPPGPNGYLSCSGGDVPLRPFVATACTLPKDGNDPQATCKRAFCTEVPNFGFSHCFVDKAEAASLPAAGVCVSNSAATRDSRVTFFQRSLACVGDDCETETASGSRCVDVTGQPAITTLLPASDRFLRSVEIIQYQADACAPTTSSTLTYALNAGPVGTAAGGGVQANVALTGGLTKLTQTCDGEVGCYVTSLDSFRANVANLNVAGVPLTNVVVRTAFAAPVTDLPDGGEGYRPGIAPGDLQLVLDGRMAGQRMLYTVQNRAPVSVDALAGGLRIAGAFDIRGVDAAGSTVPVTFTFDTRGQPATPTQSACANATPTEQLFGFESATSWSSAQASVTEVAVPVTQGCGALALSGQGFMTLTGDVFSTRRVTRAAALSVDLFIPDHQPNPFWLGNLQGFLSCPSGAVFNQYIGQVELTGKPQNRYSTLRFPLPAALYATLGRSLDDCSFSFGLNVNATGRNWLLDNLRFTQ